MPQIKPEVTTRAPSPRPFLADSRQVSPGAPGPEGASDNSSQAPEPFSQIPDKCRRELQRVPQIRAKGARPEPQAPDPFSQIPAKRRQGRQLQRVPQIKPEVTTGTPSPRPFLADSRQASPGAPGPEGASDNSRSHNQSPKPQNLSRRFQTSVASLGRCRGCLR